MRRRYWKVPCPRCGAQPGSLCVGTTDLLEHPRVHPERAECADARESWWSIGARLLVLMALINQGDFSARGLLWTALTPVGMFLALVCTIRLTNWHEGKPGRFGGWWVQ